MLTLPHRRFVRFVLCIVLFAAAAIQLIRPARTNPQVDNARTLAAAVRVPDDVAAIFDRACLDCHSNRTRWPWYSHVAPVSWFVIEHVNHGRSHFNLDDWAKYSATDRTKLLKASCDLTRKGDMPLGSYTWIHSDARLADADVAAICAFVSSLTATARRESP